MTRRFLGIDVGGTASRFVVVGEDGEELARGSAIGATGHLFAGAERKRFEQMIAEIAQAVPTGVAAVHAGVTGLGPKVFAEAQALIAARLNVAPQAVTTSDDMELAFLAAFPPGQGHLISAGTGSIGLHITAAGEAIRVGGRGLLIDDGGSGTWIALRAIDRLFRRIDETGEPGDAAILADRIYEAVGGNAWDDVRGYIYSSDRGRIGALAQVVAAAASSGDPIATQVLRDTVAELVRLARALFGRTRDLPVAFIGGVIDIHPEIRAGLTRALPGSTVSFPRIDAALHAARMARNRALET